MSITVKWLVLPDIHILCKTKNIVKLIDGGGFLESPECGGFLKPHEGDRNYMGYFVSVNMLSGNSSRDCFQAPTAQTKSTYVGFAQAV